MEASEIKENLGKEVFWGLSKREKPSKYILTAYIFRVDPRNNKKRLKQAELQDIHSPHSVVITSLNEVELKI